MAWKEVQRIQAQGDDGARYTVIEYVWVTELHPISGEPSSVKGAREWRLDDGRHVNMIDAETFEILDTDEIIRKL